MAVEPSAAIRAALDAQRTKDVVVCVATAERNGSPDACSDAVTAFHWFHSSEAFEEFHRILRPRGRVALVWNIRGQSDPFIRKFSRIVEAGAEADLRELVVRKDP